MAMIMDVSTLSAAELKRLVQTMRSRGQDELADQLSDAWSRNRVRISQASPPGPMTPPPEPPPLAAPPRRQTWLALATVAVAAIAGAGLGWALNLPGRQIALPSLAEAPPARPAEPRAALALATYAPPARPAAAPAPAPAAPTPAPAPAPTAASAATDATATVEEPAQHNACYDLPSPGERLACGFPAVAARQKRMQAAYDAAVAAGADPAALGQTAWVQAANRTWDRQALMDKMEGRIREIQAAVPAPVTTP